MGLANGSEGFSYVSSVLHRDQRRFASKTVFSGVVGYWDSEEVDPEEQEVLVGEGVKEVWEELERSYRIVREYWLGRKGVDLHVDIGRT
jgi:hypothetical protein